MNTRRQMTLNDRQRECLSTCMGSCENICYPTLGLIEEVGEYVEKIMQVVEYHEELDKVEFGFMLENFVKLSKRIGKVAKEVRHSPSGTDIPFYLKKFDDIEEVHDTMLPIWKELGDIDWMLRACEHFTGITSQMVADLNHEKLEERKRNNTIDGKGDEARQHI